MGPDQIEMVEVAPRDGLQNEKTLIETADKIALIELVTPVQSSCYSDPETGLQSAGMTSTFFSLHQLRRPAAALWGLCLAWSVVVLPAAAQPILSWDPPFKAAAPVRAEHTPAAPARPALGPLDAGAALVDDADLGQAEHQLAVARQRFQFTLLRE